MSGNVKPVFCCLLSLALVLAGMIAPVDAEPFFTVRRSFAVAFLGGSLLLAKKAVDFRRDANNLYDRYEAARGAEEAERLFDRTSDRDTKSQLSIGLSIVLLASGLRLLLLSGEDDNIPKFDRGVRLNVSGDKAARNVKVVVEKGF